MSFETVLFKANIHITMKTYVQMINYSIISPHTENVY